MGHMLSGEALSVWPDSSKQAKRAKQQADCSDHELTQKVAQGDMKALEEVYLRYHRRIYSLCLRMTQNVTEAEDLTQEIFILLMRKIGSFRGESTFSTWLYRLTTNQVLMHFRKVRARREQPTEDGLLPVQKLNKLEFNDQFHLLDHMALNRAIGQLAPGYRLVFILYDVMGHEHEEISRILGCSVGTSKSQLHKARMKLRKLLRTVAGSDEPNPHED